MGFIADSGLVIPTRDSEVVKFVRDLYDAYHAACPLERDTTYFIGQDAAGDATGGSGDGTEANPYLVADGDQWATLVGTLLAANVRIRSRRGDWFVSGGDGIDTSLANLTFDSFGDESLPNPLFVRGQWIPVGSASWAGTSGNRRIHPTTGNAAGVRIARTDFRRVWEDWERIASATDVQTNNTGARLFAVTTNVLHINKVIAIYGVGQTETITTESLDWFVYFANDHSLLTIRGTGCRIENIDCEGWGIGPANNQAYAIKVATIDHSPCVVKNCQVLYGNVHVIGANHGDGLAGDPVGAATLWENVEFGWSYPLTGATATHHNTFAKGGQFETLAINCWDVAGIMRTYIDAGTQGISFNSHSANGNKRGYQIFLNCGRRSIAETKLLGSVFNSSDHVRSSQISRQQGLAIGVYDDDMAYDDTIKLLETGLSIPNIDPLAVFSGDSRLTKSEIRAAVAGRWTNEEDKSFDLSITDIPPA